MNKAVDSIKDGDEVQQKVKHLFETTLLCGPRVSFVQNNNFIKRTCIDIYI